MWCAKPAATEIGSGGTVTVNSSGLLDLNNNQQVLNSVNALDLQGGTVTTGSSGTLTLAGTILGLANPANRTPATISGNLSLGQPGAGNYIQTIDVQAATAPLGGPDMVISAVIGGYANSSGFTSGLTKVDTGTLQLTNTETFTGPTTVSGGDLQVDGVLTHSAVTVNAGGVVTNGVGAAVLSGTGTLGAVTVTDGGTVNPGDPATGVGILTAASLNLTGSGSPTQGGNLELEVNGSTTPGVNFDQIVLSGALTLDATSTLTLDLLGLTGDVLPPGVPAIVGYSSKTGKLPSSPNVILNNPTHLQAVVADPVGSVNIIVSGTATHLGVTAPSSSVAGQPLTFTVTALDQFNNAAFAYGGTVQFTSSDTNALAQLPSPSTLTSGSGTFTATLITAGHQTITASDILTGGSLSGTSPAIVVSPNVAQDLAFSFPSSVTAGGVELFTVTALDAYNNVATGFSATIQFTSTDNQAGLPVNASITSGAGIYASSMKTAGSQSINATSGGIIGGTGPFLVNPGSLNHFGIAAPTATAGTGITITVTAEDAFNNAITGYTGTVNLTSSDSARRLRPPKRPTAARRLGILRRHPVCRGHADHLRHR